MFKSLIDFKFCLYFILFWPSLLGIHELSIDPEKNLVLIRGNIDPFLLVKEIGRTGKPVELIFYDKEPKIEEDKHQYHYERSGNCCKEKHPNHDDDHGNPKSWQNGREKHPNFCCRDDDLHPPKEDNNDEAHKDHEAPRKEKDDEEDIFKHPYFRFQRNASTNRGVPSWVGKQMFGNHADYQKQAHFDSYSSRYETWNPQCSRFFGGESASYDHYHSRMPQPPPPSYPYDFGDFENFTHYFNDYNTSGCIVM